MPLIRRLRPAFLLLTSGLLLVLSGELAHAHSGRTNSSGCHNNRRTGEYHCHNSGSTPTRTNPPQSSPVSVPSSNPTAWTVLSIGDGDTLRVVRGNETETIRLSCVDAPEMAQAYGEDAKQQLQMLLPINTPVSLRTIDTDRYGRVVAEIFSQGRNINLSLVQSGHAVAYRQYLDNCSADDYLNAEATARRNGSAFWSDPNAVMPWDFRGGSRP